LTVVNLFVFILQHKAMHKVKINRHQNKLFSLSS